MELQPSRDEVSGKRIDRHGVSVQDGKIELSDAHSSLQGESRDLLLCVVTWETEKRSWQNRHVQASVVWTLIWDRNLLTQLVLVVF